MEFFDFRFASPAVLSALFALVALALRVELKEAKKDEQSDVNTSPKEKGPEKPKFIE